MLCIVCAKIIAFTLKKQLFYKNILFFYHLNLFDLSLKLNGFPIKKATHDLELIHKKNEIDFEAYVLQKKAEIVNYHLQNNSFYKSLNNNITEWKCIPVLTKGYLQQPINQRLSKGFNSKNVYVNKTSGSSGDPFIFAKDKYCHALTWALIQNRFSWFNLDFNTSKQARFYGIQQLKVISVNKFLPFSVFCHNLLQLFLIIHRILALNLDLKVRHS